MHRPVADRRRVARPVRRAPGRRVRHRRAQGEDVRPAVPGPAVPGPAADEHLGRGEPGRARGLPVLGERGGPDALGDAEVDQLRALRAQDDVLRLQVPVRHPVGVDAREPLGQGRQQPQAGVHRQGPARRDRPGQRGSGHVLRGQPVRRGRERGVDQVRRVGRPDRPHRLGLPPEPGQRLRVPGDLVPDHLDRDQPAAGRTPEVHLPHAPGPEPGQQRVLPDTGRVGPPQCVHPYEAATPTPVHRTGVGAGRAGPPRFSAARRTGSARSARSGPSRRGAARPPARSRPRPHSYGPARTPTRPPGGGAGGRSGRC